MMGILLRRGLLRPGLRPFTALFRDTLADTDGTALGSHAPDTGGVWTVRSGAWQITGNYLVGSGADPGAPGRYLATVPDFGVADVAAGVTIRAATSGFCELVFRWTDNSNFWMVDMEVAGASRSCIVYEMAAGVLTSRATGAVSLATNTDHRLVATAVGATITAYVNGVQLAQWASATSNQTATKHGLRTAVAAGNAQFKSYVLWRSGQVVVPGGVI